MLSLLPSLYRSAVTLACSLVVFVAAGQTFTLKVNPTKDSIQWQSSPDNSNWGDIPGGNVASFLVKPVQTTYYRARVLSPGCLPVYSDIKAAIWTGDTVVGGKLVRGKLVMPAGAALKMTDYTINSLLGTAKVNNDSSFQLLVQDSAAETLLLVTNTDGNVALAGYFTGADTGYHINVETSALALLNMYPFLDPVSTTDRQLLTASYKSQPEFPALVTSLSAVVKQGGDIFSPSNPGISDAVMTLVSKTYNDYRVSARRPVSRMITSGLSSSGRQNRLSHFFEDEPITITTSGSKVTVKNNTSFSYAGGIYRDNGLSNPILVESFLLDGKLVLDNPLMQLAISKLIDNPKPVSQATYDIGQYSKLPGKYYIRMRSGLALDLSSEDVYALQENLVELSGVFIENLLPGEIGALSAVPKSCFKSLIDLQITDAKIALNKKPDADLWKDAVLPAFSNYTSIAASCIEGAAGKFFTQAFKAAKFFQGLTKPKLLVFTADWLARRKQVDGCQLIDGNNQLVKCFNLDTDGADDYNGYTCDTVRLTLKTIEDPSYYPYAGAPLPGIPFVWRIVRGNGVFGPDGYQFNTGVTDGNGLATVKWILSPTAGQGKVGAFFYAGQQQAVDSIFFDATSIKPVITLTAEVTSDNQKGAVGKVLDKPIIIHVTDQNGSLLSSDKYNVIWNMNGNGSLDTAFAPILGSFGKYWNWTLGPAAGEQQIEAVVQSKTCDWEIAGNPVVFKATAATMPAVQTVPASGITTKSAVSGGMITDDGGDSVTARGVCWSFLPNPTTGNDHTVDGSDKGSFVSQLTKLSPQQKYFVRAYATNKAGTAYGQNEAFTTASAGYAVVTTPPGAITGTSAVSGGTVSNLGTTSLVSKGVCWGTSPNPIATGNHVSTGVAFGSFITQVMYLFPGTLYHVRAYAVTATDTLYGQDESFTTGPTDTYARYTGIFSSDSAYNYDGSYGPLKERGNISIYLSTAGGVFIGILIDEAGDANPITGTPGNALADYNNGNDTNPSHYYIGRKWEIHGSISGKTYSGTILKTNRFIVDDPSEPGGISNHTAIQPGTFIVTTP